MFFNKSKRSVDAVHAASVKDKNTDLKKERGREEVGFRDDPPLAYNNFILKKLKKDICKRYYKVRINKKAKKSFFLQYFFYISTCEC